MRKEPMVCCVCLTKDRPEMLNRAIASFRAQTYPNRYLYILDSGFKPAVESLPDCYPDHEVVYHRSRSESNPSIGASRNYALGWQSDREPDIMIHWDDDDWSHPERIAEQVALLQASGKEAVGYREMLFWRDPSPAFGTALVSPLRSGEAWLYSNGNPRYCLGTSLCYWRSVWERRPFEDKNEGEDDAWRLGVDSLGVTSIPTGPRNGWPLSARDNYGEALRIIASIHGGNTSRAYQHLEAEQAQGGMWKRVPQWDKHARRVMAL